jgi:hypothetical protein
VKRLTSVELETVIHRIREEVGRLESLSSVLKEHLNELRRSARDRTEGS